MSLIGSVTAEVVPDASKFGAKLAEQLLPKVDAVSKKITDSIAKGISNGVQKGVRDSLPDFAELKAAADAVGNVHIKVEVDGTAAALTDLAGLDAGIRGVEESGKGIDPAVGDPIDRVGSKSRSSYHQIGLLSTAIALLGPAAVPIAAAVVPAIGAMAIAGAAAAAGIVATTLAFQGLGTAVKAQVKANTADKNAVSANAALAKNPKDKTAITNAAAANRAASTADAAATNAFAALSPSQVAFANYLVTIQSRFVGIKEAAASGLFPGLQAGIQSALPVLPSFEKLLHAAALGLGDIAAAAGKGLNSPFWKQFIAFVTSQVRPTLDALGKALGGILTGFAGLAQGLTPIGSSLIGTFGKLAAGFSKFGQSVAAGKSQGFNNFMAYVKSIGPTVVGVLKSLGPALVTTAKGLAPLGGISLSSTRLFLELLGKTNPKVVTALAIGFVAYKVALIGANTATFISNQLQEGSAARVALSAAAWVASKIAMGATVAVTWLLTAAQWALNVAMDANPIALVVIGIAALIAAVVLLYQHNETARNIINAVWSAIKVGIGAVVTFVVTYVWPVLKAYFTLIFDYIRLWWTVASLVFMGVRAVIQGFVGWFVQSLWPAISKVIGWIIAYYRVLFEVAKVVWTGIYNAVLFVIKWFQTSVVPVIRYVTGVVAAEFRLLQSAVGTVWSAIKTVIGTFIGWFQTSVQPKISAVATAVGKVFGGIADAARTAFAGIAGFINSYIIDPINSLIQGIDNLTSKIPGGITLPTIPHIGNYADGGYIPATPGGRIIRVAEGGQGEHVVNDTQWAAMHKGSGPSLVIEKGAVYIAGDADESKINRALQAFADQFVREYGSA